MGLWESLLLLAVLGAVFWLGHPIWLGWGWPDVTVRVRELGAARWDAMGLELVPLTVEFRAANGEVSIAHLRVFGGAHRALLPGQTLKLRCNPADPSELHDVRGAWQMLGGTFGIGLPVGLIVFFVVFGG